MRPCLFAAVAACAALFCAAPGARAADAGGSALGFQGVIRGVYLDPTSRTRYFAVKDGEFVDFSGVLRVSSRWSAELAIGYPTDIGISSEVFHYSVNLMANTLTGRYCLHDSGAFRPYVGLGLAYDHLRVNAPRGEATAVGPHIRGSSISAVAQTGLDWRITDLVSIVADVRYLPQLEGHSMPDYTGSGLSIHPLLFGLGFGFTWR